MYFATFKQNFKIFFSLLQNFKIKIALQSAFYAKVILKNSREIRRKTAVAKFNTTRLSVEKT